MIQGNLSPGGAPLLLNLTELLAFFTIVMSAAQDDELTIKFLDVFQSLFAWPSFNEGAVLTGCLWCFRAIERILGTRLLFVLLVYNFVAYLAFYILIIMLCGFSTHFPLFFFVPFGLYVYVLWNIPALDVVAYVSDKMIITLIIAVIVALQFPYGFAPLVSGIIGNILWGFDILRLRKLCESRVSVSLEENEGPLVPGIEELTDLAEVSADKVRQIEEMGFTREQATDALRANDNDVQKALDSLLRA